MAWSESRTPNFKPELAGTGTVTPGEAPRPAGGRQSPSQLPDSESGLRAWVKAPQAERRADAGVLATRARGKLRRPGGPARPGGGACGPGGSESESWATARSCGVASGLRARNFI